MIFTAVFFARDSKRGHSFAAAWGDRFDCSVRFGSLSTRRKRICGSDSSSCSIWASLKFPFHSVGMKSIRYCARSAVEVLLAGVELQSYHQLTPGESASKSFASLKSYAMPRLPLFVVGVG